MLCQLSYAGSRNRTLPALRDYPSRTPQLRFGRTDEVRHGRVGEVDPAVPDDLGQQLAGRAPAERDPGGTAAGQPHRHRVHDRGLDALAEDLREDEPFLGHQRQRRGLAGDPRDRQYRGVAVSTRVVDVGPRLSLIHISEPTRLGMISYA